MSDAVTNSAGEARAALARANVTQTHLSEITGRSQAYWSRRLSGEVPMDVSDLSAVADVAGVTVSDLVSAA